MLMSFLSFFLMLMACKTAIRVLRLWNLDSDSPTQIELEGEIWLSSTLVLYGGCFQIISLILLVFAADQFSSFLAGAMCATGSLLANDYGMVLLYVKLITSFCCGLWIMVHQLDISCEDYPLVRVKYLLLLFVLPLLGADLYLQFQYIAHLSPDIITSCCAIVFDGVKTTTSMTVWMPSPLILFYSGAAVLMGLGIVALVRPRPILFYIYALCSGTWLILALETIISTLSSFIYAMPYHHCPFCIIKPQYHFIGFFMYLALFGSAFLAMGSGMIQVFIGKQGLSRVIPDTAMGYVRWSLVLLACFVLLSSYHMVIYRLFGGE